MFDEAFAFWIISPTGFLSRVFVRAGISIQETLFELRGLLILC